MPFSKCYPAEAASRVAGSIEGLVSVNLTIVWMNIGNRVYFQASATSMEIVTLQSPFIHQRVTPFRPQRTLGTTAYGP